jgi:WD40 repeat protein
MPFPIEIEAFYRKWEHRWNADHPDSHLEKKFIEEVFCPSLSGAELINLEPQFPFKDDKDRARRIDFVLHINGKKLAIELDGIGKFLRNGGKMDPIAFNDHIMRQNSLTNPNTKYVDDLLRFTYDHVTKESVNSRQVLRTRVEQHKKNILPHDEIKNRMLKENEDFKKEILQLLLVQKSDNDDIIKLIKELKEQSTLNNNPKPPDPDNSKNKLLVAGLVLLIITTVVVFFWKNRTTEPLPLEIIHNPITQQVDIGFQALSGAFISDNRFVVSTGNLLREMSTDWSTSTLQQQKTLPSAEAILSCTADYVTGCQYAGLNTGYLHSCSDSLQLAPLGNHIIAMALPESMNKLLISMKHSGVLTLDKSTLKILDTIYTQSEINAIDFLPDSQQYVLGDKDGYVIFLSLSREVIRKVKVSSEPIRSLCKGRIIGEVFVGDNNGNLFSVADVPQKLDPFNGAIIALRLSSSNAIEVLCQSGFLYRKEL